MHAVGVGIDLASYSHVPLISYCYTLNPHERDDLSKTLLRQKDDALILNTCQRLEVYTDSEHWMPPQPASQIRAGEDALLHLARIATGLDSRILGELEIMGQVRKAYRLLVAAEGSTRLLRTIEWIIATARRARRESGIDRHLISLGGLASHQLLERVHDERPIAIIGSGNLARSCVRNLCKRGRSPIRVASRCPENALRLASEYGAFSKSLQDLQILLDGVGGILCASAAPHPLLFPEHLGACHASVQVVDLGVPPDCSAEIPLLLGDRHAGLLDIEALAAVNLGERKRCAVMADQFLRNAVNTRVKADEGTLMNRKNGVDFTPYPSSQNITPDESWRGANK